MRCLSLSSEARTFLGRGEWSTRQLRRMQRTPSLSSIRIFGIGFGYHYGGVYFAILMNTGWIGMAVYCYAFFKPVFLLPADGGGIPFKVSLATLFVLFYISVSELFLPTTWMFLGLAYWRLDKSRAHVAWKPHRPPTRTEAVPKLASTAKPQLARRNCLSNLSSTRLRGARLRSNS